MPKMKTSRSAAKRFRASGTGKIIRRRAYRSHLLRKMSSRHKRRLKRDMELATDNRRSARRLLGSR
jgi:large subunit ribosomal protein L35